MPRASMVVKDILGISSDLMRCARRPKALPPCHVHAFIPAHLSSRNLFHRIRASAFTPPHSRRTHGIHAASFTAFTPPHSRRHFYAAACTPPHSRRSHAAASMPSLSRRSFDAATLMLPPRTPPHFSVAASHRQPHACLWYIHGIACDNQRHRWYILKH